MIFGYCKATTIYQNLSSQEKKILSVFPEAKIIKEKYNSKKNNLFNFNIIKKKINTGDSIVFESILKLGETTSDILENYKFFLKQNINLLFLKEPHLDSNLLFEKFDIENSYPYSLLEKQIDIVLKKYYDTKSLIKLNTKKKLSEIDNKSLGRKKFVKVETKKSKDSKLVIKNLSKNFNGVFTDVEILKILKINRNTFYKYKKELLEEINNKN
ncbi:MAG: hypothetical protein ACRCZO_08370, partial [Cetobacterium sp.]